MKFTFSLSLLLITCSLLQIALNCKVNDTHRDVTSPNNITVLLTQLISFSVRFKIPKPCNMIQIL